MQQAHDEIREVFQRHGVRHTRQRELVYSALVQTDAHPTADELFQLVRGADDCLSLATVYNTLEALAESGLCRKFHGASSAAARFDARMTPHTHVLYADGKVRDVPADLSERLIASVPSDVLAEISERLGVPITGVSIKLSAGAVSKESDQVPQA